MLDSIVLIQFLRKQCSADFLITDFENYPWELLIRQARSANLLSRIAVFLEEKEWLQFIPEKGRLHFLSALCLANANARSAKWEVNEVYRVLSATNIDFVLLKGAAYILLENDASKGRLFSDTDIMVYKEQLDLAEKMLIKNGWFGDYFDDYKQRYYREWMHEIPPLQHLKRQTTLDVHHTIIPPTSYLRPNPKKLWEKALTVENRAGIFVLSPLDMILHSATHLFHEGEFNQGLRDISDLDLLLRQYIVIEEQWKALILRAGELNLERPLYYALNFTKKILHTPVPEHLLDVAAEKAKLNGLVKKVMDELFLRALAPNHETCKIRGSNLANQLLYIRSHWLKMPWYLLLPHLSRKAWMRLTGKDQH